MVTAPRIASSPGVAAKVLPAVVVIGVVTGVVSYVQHELHDRSQTMDRFFAGYKNPEAKASREQVFESRGMKDPTKNSLFNILSWRS